MATETVLFRRAEPNEAASLSALARAAKGAWGYPAEWMELWAEQLTFTPDYIDAHRVFVAVIGGAPIGVTVLQMTATAASLEHVWIHPAHQRRGIGRELVREALSAAAALGVKGVEVISDPYAEAFYLKLGAHRTGAVPAPMPGSPDRALPALEFCL